MTEEQTNPPTQEQVTFLGHFRLALLTLLIFTITIYGKCVKNKNNPPIKEATKIVLEHATDINEIKKGYLGDKSKTYVPYIPPEGSVTITPKDKTKTLDDLITVHYKEMGFTLEPGIECSGSLYFNCGIDAKLVFLYRFGAGVGLVGGNNALFRIAPDAFLSYRLDKIHLRNTEAILTYTLFSKIPVGVGLRINL